MFKQALYTYLTSLHPRNLKHIIEKPWTLFIVVMILLPNFNNIRDIGMGAFYPSTVLWPLVLIKISNLTGRINVPKALFLAPMHVEERRKYIKCLIGVKIGVSMLLGLIIQLVWYITYAISVLDVLVSMLAYLSFGIAEYFCVEGTLDGGVKIEHGVRVQDGNVTASSCNLLVIVGVVLMFMGYIPSTIIEKSTQTWIVLHVPYVIGLLVIILFFDIIILIRQYRDVLNTLCNYEENVSFKKVEK